MADGADGSPPTATGFEFARVDENDLGCDWHMMPLDDAFRVTRGQRASVAQVGGDWLPATWLALMAFESAELWCDTASDAVPLYLVDGHANMPGDPP